MRTPLLLAGILGLLVLLVVLVRSFGDEDEGERRVAEAVETTRLEPGASARRASQRIGEADPNPADEPVAQGTEASVPEVAGRTRGSVTLRVREGDGGPVVGREVVLQAPRAGLFTRGITNARGDCRFDDVEFGSWVAIASPGVAARAIISREEPDADVMLATSGGFAVSGTARLESGAPAVGAVILTHELFFEGLVFEVARADEEGRFAFPFAGRSYCRLTARLEGCGESNARTVRAAASETVELVLPDFGAALDVRVETPDGAELPHDTRIFLVDRGEFTPTSAGESPEPRKPRPHRVTRPDDTGRARFEHLGRGTHVLLVHAEGRAPVDESVVFDLATTLSRTVVLGPAAVVTGLITSGEVPVSEAWVTWDHDFLQGRLECRTPTDSSGRFRLENLPVGRVELRVRKGAAEKRVEVFSVAGGTTDVRIRLDGLAELRGRCVTDTGDALPELEVFISAPGYQPPFTHTKTDADGAFTCIVDPVRQEVRVRDANRIDHLADRSWSPGDGDLHFIIPEARLARSHIVGRVVDRDGNPLAGRLQCRYEHDGASAISGHPIDPDGRFSIGPVAAGPRRLVIERGDGSSVVVARVEVPQDATLDVGEITVDFRTGSIRVGFSGPLRLLQGSTRIRVRGPFETKELSYRGDELTESGLPPGDHLLIVTGDHVAPIELPFRLKPDEETVIVVPLEPGGTPCVVRWPRDPEGPRASFRLSIARAETPDLLLIQDGGNAPEGAFIERTYRLAPGVYRLTMTEVIGRRAESVFTVTDRDDEVVIPLAPG